MRRILQGMILAGVVAALVSGFMTLVATDETAAAQCPRRGIFCTTHWDPVICSNGQTYSNACYAYVACATGCVPTGGGPVVVEAQ